MQPTGLRCKLPLSPATGIPFHGKRFTKPELGICVNAREAYMYSIVTSFRNFSSRIRIMRLTTVRLISSSTGRVGS